MYFSAFCDHIISQDYFEFMFRDSELKKKPQKCPVPGCKANWFHASVSRDKAFEYRCERFYRTKKPSSHASEKTQKVEDLDDAL